MCLASGQIIIDSRAWVWTDGVALDFDPTSFPVVQKNTIRCARVEFRPPTLPHTVNLYPLPPRHVVGVGSQVGAGLVEGVVKLQIEVMRLQVDRRQHRGHGAGEFAEAIENVLRLQRHTFFERLAVDRRGGSDFPRLFPGTRCVRMERTPRGRTCARTPLRPPPAFRENAAGNSPPSRPRVPWDWGRANAHRCRSGSRGPAQLGCRWRPGR
jgi:hypothetical protein